MSKVIDQTADRDGRALHRFNQLYKLPSYVKTASADEMLQSRELPLHQYADPVARLFPCDSKAATWLSAAHFQEQQRHMSKAAADRTAAGLEKWAAYWGLLADVKALEKCAQDLQKEAAEESLPDSAFALVEKQADGSTTRKYPVRNANEAEAAARWLIQYRNEIPFAERNKVAAAILKHDLTAMSPENIDILRRMAGYGVCNPAKVAHELHVRSRLTKSAKHRERFQQLADMVEKSPADTLKDEANRVKLAGILDLIDREQGWYLQYDRGLHLTRPEELLFEATYKTAADEAAQMHALPSGAIYATEQFQKLSAEALTAIGGQELVAVLCENGSVAVEKLAALSLQDATDVEYALQQAGEKPIARQTAAPVQLSAAVCRELAG